MKKSTKIKNYNYKYAIVLLILIITLLISIFFVECTKNCETSGGCAEPLTKITTSSSSISIPDTTVTESLSFDLEVLPITSAKGLEVNPHYCVLDGSTFRGPRISYNNIVIKNNGPGNFYLTDASYALGVKVELSETNSLSGNTITLLQFIDDTITSSNPIQSGSTYSIKLSDEYDYGTLYPLKKSSDADGYYVFVSLYFIPNKKADSTEMEFRKLSNLGDKNENNNDGEYITRLKADWSGDKGYSITTNSKDNVDTHVMLFKDGFLTDEYLRTIVNTKWSGDKSTWMSQYQFNYLGNSNLCPYYMSWLCNLTLSDFGYYYAETVQEYLTETLNWALKSAVVFDYLDTKTAGTNYYVRVSISPTVTNTPATYNYTICLKETGNFFKDVSTFGDIDQFSVPYDNTTVDTAPVGPIDATGSQAIALTPGTPYHTKFADELDIHWYKISF